MRALFVTIVFVFALTSCYYDSEEALFPQVDVKSIDTTSNISYSAVIDPIIKNNCRSCHSKGNSVQLNDFNDINGQADIIYKTIIHAPGVLPMPQGAPQLSKAYQVAFKKWIEQGKQNN